jgi:RimJ/RimL family protein N-acetyltransferase
VAPSKLVFGEDERVAKWCQERLPNFSGWQGGYYVAIGREKDSVLNGGIVFTDCTRCNMTLSIVLEAPFTRPFLRAIFYYPFLQMKVRRVTALVNSKNLKSRRLCEHTGFVQEGVLRDGAVDDDVIIFGMTRNECRYLP